MGETGPERLVRRIALAGELGFWLWSPHAPLGNEICRIGEADLDQLRFESLQGNSCNRALRRMLDYYEQAFNCHITPHTRAMLNRQYSDLQQIYHEMDLLPVTT